MSRLGSMTHDFASTTHDLTLAFAYSPASQIVEATRSNNLYAWTGHGSGTTNSTANGLNQLASHGGATPTHDSKGNLTSDAAFSFTYSSENLMTSGANSGALGYDPLMRFYQSGPTYFIHEGGQTGSTRRSLPPHPSRAEPTRPIRMPPPPQPLVRRVPVQTILPSRPDSLREILHGGGPCLTRGPESGDVP